MSWIQKASVTSKFHKSEFLKTCVLTPQDSTSARRLVFKLATIRQDTEMPLMKLSLRRNEIKQLYEHFQDEHRPETFFQSGERSMEILLQKSEKYATYYYKICHSNGTNFVNCFYIKTENVPEFAHHLKLLLTLSELDKYTDCQIISSLSGNQNEKLAEILKFFTERSLETECFPQSRVVELVQLYEALDE